MVNEELMAIVVRFTQYESVGPEQWVDLMSWHTDLALAEAEADRLNLVNRNDLAEYFVKIVKKRGGKATLP